MILARILAVASLAGIAPATAAFAASGAPSKPDAASAKLAAPVPLNAAQLGEISGGQGTQLNQTFTTQTLTAQSSGNQVNAANVQSGAVSFAGGALQGFTGIGNFVINTGNNDILQGNLSVTVAPLR